MKICYSLPIETKDIVVSVVDDGEETLLLDIDFIRKENKRKIGVIIDAEYDRNGKCYTETLCSTDRSADLDGDFEFEFETDFGTYTVLIEFDPECYSVQIW